MKKNSILMFAFLTVFAFGVQTASAQIPINIPKIPKIPKIKKDTTEKPKQDTPTTPEKESPANETNQSNENKSDDNRKTETETKKPEQDIQYYTFGAYKLYLDDLEATVKTAEEYTSNSDRAIYTYSERYDWGLIAVSPSARNDSILGNSEFAAWRKANPKNRWDVALDKLAALLAKNMPTFKGGLANYKFRNPADEKVLKTVFEDITQYQIYSYGIKQSSWLIEKSDYGLPNARYKHAVFYLKDKKGDHPYCYLTYVNIIQGTAGGGTYAASRARFIEDQLVGCPTGAK